jgi:ABC-2 type transport system permease protein
MTVCGSLNGTSSSTFSREGKHFWISQVIPVAPRDQAAAKFLHSYLVALLGIAAATIVCIFVFHLGTGVLAAAIVLALAAAVPLVVAGMIIDLARPLLDWTNPQKAIKQNLNVLLALAADAGILTALYFFVKFLLRAGLSQRASLAVLLALLVALGVGAWRFLADFADRRYRNIET